MTTAPAENYPEHPFAPPPPPPPPRRKRHWLRWTLISVGAFIALIIGIAAAAGGSHQTAQPAALPSNSISTAPAAPELPSAPDTTSEPAAPAPATPTQPPAPAPAKPTQPPAAPAKPTQQYTPAQENAIGAAKDYLAMTGFSRAGLIKQLSSSYGDGYSEADATFAVDHLNVEWNQEAVRSAKEYLSMTHFSRAGLIEQLSSPYGSGYTVAQATYAANQVGL